MVRSNKLTPEDLLPHMPWVRALAAGLVGATSEDDLVQDVVVAALSKPPRESRALGAWLKTVTRRKASNLRREDRNRRIRERAAARLEVLCEEAPDTAELEMHLLLVDAVRGLPDRYRRVMILRYFHDRSTREIATELGITETNVRSRQHRALEKLREELDERSGGREQWRSVFMTALRGGEGAGLAATSPLAGISSLFISLITHSWIALLLVAFVVFAWPDGNRGPSPHGGSAGGRFGSQSCIDRA